MMAIPPNARSEHSPRVLFVDHSGLPGGGQLGLARYLMQSRLTDVHVAILSRGSVFDGVHTERGFPVVTLGATESIKALLATRLRLRRYISETRPDVIVANSNKAALLVASIPQEKYAVRAYYMRDDLNPQRKSFLKRKLLGSWMMPKYGLIIANSRWTASTVPTTKLAKRVKIAYPVSGVLKLEAPFSSRVGGPLRILSLSRITHWKGIHVLLDAVRILEQRGYGRHINLSIAGTSTHEDPSYEREMWERASQLETPLRFLGHVDDASTLLRENDVLVACSISPEPFGQVIVQGMASGLVTIASSEGGPVELIDAEQTGFLLPPGDAGALADMLQELAEDPTLVERVRRAAVEAVAAFSDGSTVQALDEILGQSVHS